MFKGINDARCVLVRRDEQGAIRVLGRTYLVVSEQKVRVRWTSSLSLSLSLSLL
jgi:hypothetical protein